MGKSKVKKAKRLYTTRVVDGETFAHEILPDAEQFTFTSPAEAVFNALKEFPAQERETILEEAERLVGGARRQHYGPPNENFERIAGAWSAYLGINVTPLDVCCLMIMLKVARIRTGGSYHRDSAVDAAGYARLLEILSEGE